MHSPSGVKPPNLDSDYLRQYVLAEQVAMLCRYSQGSLALGISMTAFLCWLLWPSSSPALLLSWSAAVVVMSAARGTLQHRFLAMRATPNVRRRVRILCFAIALTGLLWSIPVNFLVPDEPMKQMVLGVVSVGLCASALGSLTPVRYAYLCFILPYTLPVSIQYLLLGGSYTKMAIGLIAFVLVTLQISFRNSKGTEELLRLQVENAALAERLRQENEIVERANRDLESQITWRERTETELRIAKQQAEAANHAKNQFLANMSHELRTPLNGVLGTSELLIRSLSNIGSMARQLRQAQTIRTTGEQLSRLINDILDMARIEAGTVRFEHSAFYPRQLIIETVESLAEQSTAKQLEITSSIADNVPNIVLGDAYRLRQVLVNLVANAIKFTEQGGVRIELNATPIADVSSLERMSLRWSVIDTGIGIPEHASMQLFQPFSQVDDSFTRRFGGTGLGLAICRQIVSALGGHIAVVSTPAKGSTFWFDVPLDILDEAADLTMTPNVTPSDALSGRVLVAEDNNTNCQLIVEMLELAGCQATTAANGQEALEKLTRAPFDAVLMDWHMPQMDGLDATREWRAREALSSGSRRVPIIALTASVLPGDREACLQAGMDDFIPKPFTYNELVTVLRRWLPARDSVKVNKR